LRQHDFSEWDSFALAHFFIFTLHSLAHCLSFSLFAYFQIFTLHSIFRFAFHTKAHWLRD
jgi:hypothetical protein